MRKMAPINVIVYYPKTEEGQDELRRRVALVHVDVVNRRLKELRCPEKQKLELLDAVIDTVRKVRTVPSSSIPMSNRTSHPYLIDHLSAETVDPETWDDRP